MNEQNQQLTISSTSNTEISTLIKSFKELEEFVKTIKGSTLAKGFEKNVDGKRVIEENDIAIAIMLGIEAGIKPMEAVMLGTRINLDSYGAIKLGKSLGLDYNVAMSKIFTFTTSAGPTYALSSEIYILLCNMYKVKRKIIKEYEPVYGYYVVKTVAGKATTLSIPLFNDEAFDPDGTLKPNIRVRSTMTTEEDVKSHAEMCEALHLQVVVVDRKVCDMITSVRFIREDIGFDEVISYSRQDAIDAALYPGITRRGEVLTTEKAGISTPVGKDNWIKMEPAMLMARVIAKGTRACVPERTINTLAYDEAINAIDITGTEENVTNAMNKMAEEATVITND